MDSHSIHTFLTVSKEQSFTRAAEKLHLTQPAISKRIANLEKTLDCLLFDRIGKDVKLTASGQLFLIHAEQLSIAFKNCLTELDNFNHTITGTLNIGVSHHIGLHRLPPVLKAFSQAHPRVNLQISFIDSEDAYNSVLDGSVEFALATLNNAHDTPRKLTERIIWPDPLIFTVSKTHPLTMLARNKALSPHDLLSFPAILPKPSTVTGEIIGQLFAKQQLQLARTIETNYLETIKMMTTVGLGWSVIPKNMLSDDLFTLDIEQSFLTRNLGLITHQERSLSNASNAFIAMLADKITRQP